MYVVCDAKAVDMLSAQPAGTDQTKPKSKSCVPVTVDVSVKSGRDELIKKVAEVCGSEARLHVLVNNVGTNQRETIERSTEEQYETVSFGFERTIVGKPRSVTNHFLLRHHSKMLRTNIDSMFFLTKGLSSLLKGEKGPASSVINVASVAGVRSSGTGTIYALTKGAMVQFTRTLSCEWARSGVRVNCVAPWMTMTPLLRAAVAKVRKA